jgi:excisionase family DNA binding protein
VTVSPLPDHARQHRPHGPTLDEIRTWPATVSVGEAAAALGCSQAHAYDCIRTGTLPARTLRVGGRIRVVTASILAALECGDGGDGDGGAAA